MSCLRAYVCAKYKKDPSIGIEVRINFRNLNTNKAHNRNVSKVMGLGIQGHLLISNQCVKFQIYIYNSL